MSARRKKVLGSKRSSTRRVKTKAKESFDLNLSKITEYIKTRAYYIWEEEGRPWGKDIEIWRRAEKEIFSQLIKKR